MINEATLEFVSRGIYGLSGEKFDKRSINGCGVVGNSIYTDLDFLRKSTPP